MKRLSRATWAAALAGLGLWALIVTGQSLQAAATRAGRESKAQSALAPASSSAVAHEGYRGLVFSDEFEGSALDAAKWDVIKEDPTVGAGELTLPGSATGAEVQSMARFQYGVLQVAVRSADWTSQAGTTDSSVGFEIWGGANGQCHHGVVLIANGHLGVLRSEPDAGGECHGDPEYQAYVPISNWEALRAADRVVLTLRWSRSGVILDVSDGGTNGGRAAYWGESNPRLPLEIRLNAEPGDEFQFDYARVAGLEDRTILVDDFDPQPLQDATVWPYNRLGGDRARIDGPGSGTVDWGRGVVTATIDAGTVTWMGVWTALKHPIRDHSPLDFSAIFPARILPAYQGHIAELQIRILDGAGMFQVELCAQDAARGAAQGAVSPALEIVKWRKSATLSGGPQTLNFSLPITLGEVQNLNWLVVGSSGDFVAVERVAVTATLPQLDRAERAFLWSYGMLLDNWEPTSGLTRDRAGYAAGEFDNVSASGMQAAAAVMAWRLGFISKGSATEIVTQTSAGLLALPRETCGGNLWPHFVQNGQIVAGTEWSSIDTVIASVALIEAQQALGLETAAVEQVLTGIDWEGLILDDGHISHGYWSDCRPIEPGGTGGWRDFGTESWLVNLAYAAATGNVAAFDHTSPTFNGSGFIDELAWLLLPPPCQDRWGTNWCDYREQAVEGQLAYYQGHPCYGGPPRLFGLSAGEVPDLSIVPTTQTYQAFGVRGEIAPNDGSTLLGHAVVVPHYAAMVAALRPDAATDLWEWLEAEGLFTPLNNVESLMFGDEGICEAVTWNALKGSWNLSLQTLGWGRLLVGDKNPLFDSVWFNALLRRGYLGLWNPEQRVLLPVVIP